MLKINDLINKLNICKKYKRLINNYIQDSIDDVNLKLKSIIICNSGDKVYRINDLENTIITALCRQSNESIYNRINNWFNNHDKNINKIIDLAEKHFINIWKNYRYSKHLYTNNIYKSTTNIN